MKSSYIDYSMSVIVSRALPDVRDGLKPVQRRVLYGMSELGVTSGKPFKKSARIVGEVLGKYHPHGDSSVYMAMVRMAQSWSLRYPLVDGQGNFGSVDGDSPAAMRYTEARLMKVTEDTLVDLDKDTVDMIPNFDESLKEPSVLPTRIPLLLVNGASGIAVGMATNIPPHNLTEVLNGVIAQIEDPLITVEDLMEYIKGPDFPTKALIMGRSGIRSAYTTGKGKVIVRAKTEIVENRDGTSSIIVTELPYQVNKKMLVESIAALVKDKKIEGLHDIDDHSSDRVGIRLEISLKRDVNAQVVLNKLFKFTRLQDSFSINMLAICDGKPKILGLKDILSNFISFQEDIVRRRTKYDLDKALARMHILEGLKIAIANIDEVIEIIRNSYDDAKERLMARFGFSEIQAQSVLDMKLSQLQRLNSEKIENEYNDLSEKAEEYKGLLADEHKLLEQIKKELIEIRDKYGDERLTSIENGIVDIEDEDLIPVEECVVTMTHFGYVKRLPSSTYRSQHRGGRGISGLSTRDEDFVENIFVTSSHNFILFFTNKGKVYRIKGYEIPEGSRSSRGTNVVNILPLEQEEKITCVIKTGDIAAEDKYYVMVTRHGVIKRTEYNAYMNVRKSGLIAINLDEGDELAWVKITGGSDDIILATENGMSIRFNEQDARSMGRTARGVKAITLEEGDEVIGMVVAEAGKDILTVSRSGLGRRTDLSKYRLQSRGGKGLRNYAVSGKTGKVVGIRAVDADDDIMLISSDGIIIRMQLDAIPLIGRSTQGVRLMRLQPDVSIVNFAVTERAAEEPEQAEADGAPEPDAEPV